MRTAWEWIDKEKLWRWRRQEKRSLAWCANELGRSIKATRVMLAKLADDREPPNSQPMRCGAVEQIVVDSDALADREKRLSLIPRDSTAALMGDPLPGYSALCRRSA